jgi:hypothetical protein
MIPGSRSEENPRFVNAIPSQYEFPRALLEKYLK